MNFENIIIKINDLKILKINLNSHYVHNAINLKMIKEIRGK